MRVALHLNLKSLASGTLAQLSASANASGGASSVSPAVSGHEALQTVKTAFNYSNYVVKASTDTTKGTRTITYGAVDTTKDKVESFALQSGTTTKTIPVSGASGSGTKSETGLCDYTYSYSGGVLTVTVKNISEAVANLNVQANIVPAQTNMVLNLQVNNSAVNSLLVLTLLNGDNKICEYGFVYCTATQATSIELPMNTTIKILATKPFGSRVELLLDGATLAPTGVTSYDVPTGTGASKTLVVNLVGNSQWSNAIVI